MKRSLLTLLFTLFLPGLYATPLEVSDALGNEIHVEIYPAEGDLLVIWFTDHEERRPVFESMLQAVNAAGIEIWRADLLQAYFLPRSSESVRTLKGDGVAALLQAAHRLSDKRLLLAAYDRMPLPLLRGVHLWQRDQPISRLLGAVLFYPNLFGPPPVAGEPPILDPIVSTTTIPLVIYQPDLGSQRWRLPQVMSALWLNGSSSYAYLVPQVRDWFFMGESDHGPDEEAAIRAIPRQLQLFSRLLAEQPSPPPRETMQPDPPAAGVVQGLVRLPSPSAAAGFSLSDIHGAPFQLHATQTERRVTLINFWATWCPPCVEEIPSLNRLASRYQGQPFSVLSIDYRESKQTLQQFMQRVSVDFPVLLDTDGRVALEWNVFSLPSSFIIDRKGFIRYSVNRAIDWNTPDIWSVIDSLLMTE